MVYIYRQGRREKWDAKGKWRTQWGKKGAKGESAKGGGKGRERGDGHDGRFNGQTMACKTVRF